MREGPIRVAILFEEALLLKALTFFLEQQTQFAVVGAVHHVVDFLRSTIETQPDIAVLDVDITEGGVFDIAREIQRRAKQTRLIFVSRIASECLVEHALLAGARGYLTKRESPEKILEAIRQVADGESYFSDEVAEKIDFDAVKGTYVIRTETALSHLTSRQLEVLRHLARGESVKQVAKTMHLSEKSVDSHKYRIMTKLGIHDRVLLTRLAIREGLMLP